MAMNSERSTMEWSRKANPAGASLLKRSLIVLFLMLVSMLLGAFWQPKELSAELAKLPDYEALVPATFGQWVMIDSPEVQVVNPQQQQVLDAIYRQVVNRVYRNLHSGNLVMLSLASGIAQTKQSQVHLPERCYPAQGFEIKASWSHPLSVDGAKIPTQRMIATLGGRREAVTYWIRLGGRMVSGAVDQKISTILEGLSGRVADGIVFRVSTVGVDEGLGFSAQESFIRDFMTFVQPDQRRFFVGDES
jgi:EpsI family protein